jgi:hypothetical protein
MPPLVQDNDVACLPPQILTLQSGPITRLASDLSWVHQKYNCTVTVQLQAAYVMLQQHTTGVTITTTMAATSGNGPLAPHMRPCAPCQHVEWIGDNPPSKRI